MCEATAGFSVGEIAALTFAGSITFENGMITHFYIIFPNYFCYN